MTAVVQDLDVRRIGFASKACSDCGHRFFTSLALYGHMQEHHPPTPPPRPERPSNFSPAGLVRQQARGRQIAAENNARRRRCDGCGHISTPAGIGNHQKYTGHEGWTEVS